MNKVLSVIFGLAFIVTYVNAAAAIYPYEPKPAKFACQEGCYLKSLNRVLPYNVPYYPKGKCEEYTCKTNNQTEWYSCGLIGVLPGCTVVRDLSKRYPECCARVECDDGITAVPATTDATTL